MKRILHWIRQMREFGGAPHLADAQIGFYASSWMDEVWIRTTALTCRDRGLRVVLIVDGDSATSEPEVVDLYRSHDIPVLRGDSVRSPFKGDVVVSASTGPEVGKFTHARKVHMPHSLVSLHMIYAPAAFDAYDDILAAGPHHIAEFVALGRQRGLAPKRTHPVGYGKLDLLIADQGGESGSGDDSVLIAPSWGPNNMLSTLPIDWIGRLLDDAVKVTLRPHPLFYTVHPDAIQAIEDRFGGDPRFVLEDPNIAGRSIHAASALVTDYSGTAFEYAALRRRPAVFVDVAPKVFNPDYAAIGIEPVEVGLRTRIGLMAEATPDSILACVHRAMAADGDWTSRISAELPRFVYNPGRCAAVAADVLADMVGTSA